MYFPEIIEIKKTSFSLKYYYDGNKLIPKCSLKTQGLFFTEDMRTFYAYITVFVQIQNFRKVAKKPQ